MRRDPIFGKIPTRAAEGFTLVELMIAMAVGLVLVGAATQSFIAQRKISAAQEQVTEMYQNARAAVDFMMRELRSATSIITLDPTPDNSSITYVSLENDCQNRGFNLSGNTLRYYRHYPNPGRAGCPASTKISPEPLAENITSLTVTSSGNLFTITLVARTAALGSALGRSQIGRAHV